jgi:hypothetical protein
MLDNTGKEVGLRWKGRVGGKGGRGVLL